MTTTAMSTEQRRTLLQQEIEKYVRQGYIVVSQTDASAQLMRRKRFSFIWALIWFLALGIGLVVYLLWYAAARDQNVYLTIDPLGKITARR